MVPDTHSLEHWMALWGENDQTVNLSSPTLLPFLFFINAHVNMQCIDACFLPSFVSLLLTCDSLGANWKKKCSAPFSKASGRIFLGKSEECTVSTSAHPQVTPCTLHTLRGLKCQDSQFVCSEKTACTFPVSVSHIFVHTHSHAHIHKLLCEDAWCHVYNDNALSMSSCKV